MKKLVFGMFLTVLLLLMVNPVQAAVSYQVQYGDTLWNIAQAYNVPVEIIISQNNINDPADLYVGQRLIISNSNNNVVITIEDSSNNYQVYYVKSGDTLWEIANKFNTTIEEIVAANDSIDQNYQIYLGQRLLIPSSGYTGNSGYNNGNDYDNSYDNNYDNDYGNRDYQNNYGQVYRSSYATYYIVKPGDILWNIAQRFNTTVSRIIDLNHIRDAYDIYPGKRLIVWLADYNTSPGNNSDYDQPEQDNGSQTPDDGSTDPQEIPERVDYAPYYLYTVHQNDTIRGIASRFGISVNDLKESNQGAITTLTTPGRVLVIPLENTSRLSSIRDINWRFNNYYQVRNYESLADIADYFGLPEEGLRKINNLTANQEILNDQVLLMPVSPYLFGRHQTYTTEDNTTPEEIATKLNVSLDKLLKANFMRNKKYPLKTGTSILIPLV